MLKKGLRLLKNKVGTIGLKESLEKNVERIRATMNKDLDEREILSQMMLGLQKELNEVEEELDTFDYFVQEMLPDELDDGDKQLVKVKETAILLEVGDVMWYAINAMPSLNLEDEFAVINSSIQMITNDEVVRAHVHHMHRKILDQVTKYLFQRHDLSESMLTEFQYYVAVILKVVSLILDSLENYNNKKDIEFNFSLGGIIEANANKLYKRYGDEFDKEKSQKRKQ